MAAMQRKAEYWRIWNNSKVPVKMTGKMEGCRKGMIRSAGGIFVNVWNNDDMI
jgi:hypothetical protein